MNYLHKFVWALGPPSDIASPSSHVVLLCSSLTRKVCQLRILLLNQFQDQRPHAQLCSKVVGRPRTNRTHFACGRIIPYIMQSFFRLSWATRFVAGAECRCQTECLRQMNSRACFSPRDYLICQVTHVRHGARPNGGARIARSAEL